MAFGTTLIIWGIIALTVCLLLSSYGGRVLIWVVLHTMFQQRVLGRSAFSKGRDMCLLASYGFDSPCVGAHGIGAADLPGHVRQFQC